MKLDNIVTVWEEIDPFADHMHSLPCFPEMKILTCILEILTEIQLRMYKDMERGLCFFPNFYPKQSPGATEVRGILKKFVI